MKRFLISLTLVFGVVTGVAYGAVVRPGIGFAKPDVESPYHGQYADESDDNLLIIIVDGSAFEADGYYIFVYREKTLMGIFYDIQSPTGLLWVIYKTGDKGTDDVKIVWHSFDGRAEPAEGDPARGPLKRYLEKYSKNFVKRGSDWSTVIYSGEKGGEYGDWKKIPNDERSSLLRAWKLADLPPTEREMEVAAAQEAAKLQGLLIARQFGFPYVKTEQGNYYVALGETDPKGPNFVPLSKIFKSSIRFEDITVVAGEETNMVLRTGQQQNKGGSAIFHKALASPNDPHPNRGIQGEVAGAWNVSLTGSKGNAHYLRLTVDPVCEGFVTALNVSSHAGTGTFVNQNNNRRVSWGEKNSSDIYHAALFTEKNPILQDDRGNIRSPACKPLPAHTYAISFENTKSEAPGTLPRLREGDTIMFKASFPTFHPTTRRLTNRVFYYRVSVKK